MRNSILLLATSLALHVSDVGATAAAAETVIDPNQAHTFRDIKNDTRVPSFVRSNGKIEDDERTLPFTSGKTSQKISEFFAGKAQKIMDAGKNLRRAPKKSPEIFFNEIRTRAEGTSDIEKINSVLMSTDTEEMERALNAFKQKNTFLLDAFIQEWGEDAVFVALREAIEGNIEQAQSNAWLMINSAEYIDHFYHNSFKRLKLNIFEKKYAVFIDGRVKLLDDYLNKQSIMKWQDPDQALFSTLRHGFGGFGNLAHLIALANAKSESQYVKDLLQRFLEYYKNRKEEDTSVVSFFRQLELPKHGYKMFQRPEFGMVAKYEELAKKDWEDPDIIRVLIKGLDERVFKGETKLALVLSKGVEKNDEMSKEYEEKFFHYLDDRDIYPGKFKTYFTRKELAFKPAAVKFIERYDKWYYGRMDWVGRLIHNKN